MITNCYHGRDNRDVKLFGGMLHASSHDEAAQHACHGLEVKISPSGRAYFVDKEGRKVSLYISVHPEHTAKGEEALKAHQKEEWDKYMERARLGQFDDCEDEESEDS